MEGTPIPSPAMQAEREKRERKREVPCVAPHFRRDQGIRRDGDDGDARLHCPREQLQGERAAVRHLRGHNRAFLAWSSYLRSVTGPESWTRQPPPSLPPRCEIRRNVAAYLVDAARPVSRDPFMGTGEGQSERTRYLHRHVRSRPVATRTAAYLTRGSVISAAELCAYTAIFNCSTAYHYARALALALTHARTRARGLSCVHETRAWK